MKVEGIQSTGGVSGATSTDTSNNRRSWVTRPLILLILWVAFSVASSVIAPPDVVSQITLMVEMFIVYGVVIFAVSRFKSFKQTPDSMKRVIVALVCLLSIAVVSSSMLYSHCRRLSTERYEYTTPQDHLE